MTKFNSVRTQAEMFNVILWQSTILSTLNRRRAINVTSIATVRAEWKMKWAKYAWKMWKTKVVMQLDVMVDVCITQLHGLKKWCGKKISSKRKCLFYESGEREVHGLFQNFSTASSKRSKRKFHWLGHAHAFPFNLSDQTTWWILIFHFSLFLQLTNSNV